MNRTAVTDLLRLPGIRVNWANLFFMALFAGFAGAFGYLLREQQAARVHLDAAEVELAALRQSLEGLASREAEVAEQLEIFRSQLSESMEKTEVALDQASAKPDAPVLQGRDAILWMSQRFDHLQERVNRLDRSAPR